MLKNYLDYLNGTDCKMVYDKKINPTLSDGLGIVISNHCIEAITISVSNADWICKILDAIDFQKGINRQEFYYHMYRGGRENFDNFFFYHTTEATRQWIEDIIEDLAKAKKLNIPCYIAGVEILFF